MLGGPGQDGDDIVDRKPATAPGLARPGEPAQLADWCDGLDAGLPACTHCAARVQALIAAGDAEGLVRWLAGQR